MSAIGPDLPPHLLAKRARKGDVETEDEHTTASGANLSLNAGDGEKRRRIAGPVMPPPPLDERPGEPSEQTNLEEEDNDGDGDGDDDDDDFGPALPIKGTEQATKGNDADSEDSPSQQGRPSQPGAELRRDEWMMMPPKQDDLAARMDPTKQRPRGFNTGKGPRGPDVVGGDGSSWNETPEQKQKRLHDEMMGVAKPSAGGLEGVKGRVTTNDDVAAVVKRREQKDETRGLSLLVQHKQNKGAEAEDDPSKRAFDRDKDLASGMRISGAQRKEMLNKAAGFSSRFSSGSYL